MTREELQAHAERIAADQGPALVIDLLLEYLERGYFMELYKALDDAAAAVNEAVENLTFIR